MTDTAQKAPAPMTAGTEELSKGAGAGAGSPVHFVGASIRSVAPTCLVCGHECVAGDHWLSLTKRWNYRANRCNPQVRIAVNEVEPIVFSADLIYHLTPAGRSGKCLKCGQQVEGQTKRTGDEKHYNHQYHRCNAKQYQIKSLTITPIKEDS